MSYNWNKKFLEGIKPKIGLDNVSNDAQLKRASGDFGSFDQETSLNVDDVVLIEKNGTGEKRFVKYSNFIGTNNLSMQQRRFDGVANNTAVSVNAKEIIGVHKLTGGTPYYNNIDYNTSSEYDYDANNIDFSSGSAKLAQVESFINPVSTSNFTPASGGPDVYDFLEQIWSHGQHIYKRGANTSTDRNIYRYTPSNNSWISPLTIYGTEPLAQVKSAIVVDHDNAKTYIQGGQSISRTSYNNLHVFDIATSTWSELSPTGYTMPSTYYQGGAILNGEIYYKGFYSSQTLFIKYTISTNTYSVITPTGLSVPSGYGNFVWAYDSCIYFTGGVGSNFGTIYKYDPSSNVLSSISISGGSALTMIERLCPIYIGSYLYIPKGDTNNVYRINLLTNTLDMSYTGSVGLTAGRYPVIVDDDQYIYMYRTLNSFSKIKYLDMSYPINTYNTITQDVGNGIDLSNVGGITGVLVNNGDSLPANTNIKFLVSFDNNTTWKYWNGSIYVESTLSNIGTNGIDLASISDLLTNWNNSLGTTINIAAGLLSSDGVYTPALDNIRLTLIPDNFNAELAINGQDYTISRVFDSIDSGSNSSVSSTDIDITNISGGELDLGITFIV